MTDTPTALDRAHLAAEATPEDTALRAAIYQRLADTELFVLLAGEAMGGSLTPRIFDLDEGPYVLAFDREDRLAAFTGGPADYAAIPGRVLAPLLAQQNLGLGLNLNAVSARLLPPDALDWLAGMLGAPLDAEAGTAPNLTALPAAQAHAVVAALTPRLPDLAGMGRAIHLLQTDTGALWLQIEAAPAPLHAPMAQMLAETLRFAAPDLAEGARMGFADSAPDADAPRIPLPDFPPPQSDPAPEAPKAPGSDPDKPPILRF